jgi:putative transposase
MKQRHTEELIIGILKSHEKGMTIADICRKNNISEQTFYRWKSKYGGMEISDAKKLKQLEDENRRLKQLVGELTLDNQALKWIVEKNS